MQSVLEDSRLGAVRREWPLPFSRTATPDWNLWDAPYGRVRTEHPVNARSLRSGRLPSVASALERAGKRPPAVLRLWARAKAIPGEARLALNRFPTRCICDYYLYRVLAIPFIVTTSRIVLPNALQTNHRSAYRLSTRTGYKRSW